MIRRLTKDQERMLPEIRDEWFRYGLSTEPVCHATIEPLFARLYSELGFARPQVYLLDSPLAALAATHAFALARPTAVGTAVGTAVRTAVRTAVGTAVGTAVRTAVEAAVGTAVQAAVRTAVGTAVEVRTAVEAAVRTAVQAAVRTAVDAAVGTAVEAAVEAAVWSYNGGSMWAAWPAYIVAMRRIGVELPPAATTYAELAKHCGWYWTLPGVVFASTRPSEIHLVDGRLHNDRSPAVCYPDSATTIWSFRGVTVNEQIVMRPETQTLADIHREENVEVKRIRIERFGWNQYLRASNAKVIEHVRNEISQTDESLMECEIGRVLVCACPSTARVYALEVPPDCSTVEQAQGFLSGGRARRIIGAT